MCCFSFYLPGDTRGSWRVSGVVSMAAQGSKVRTERGRERLLLSVQRTCNLCSSKCCGGFLHQHTTFKINPFMQNIKTYWLSWGNWVSLGFGSYIEGLWWTVFFSIFWHSHACLQQHIGSIRVIKASNYFVSINAYTFSQASIIPGLDYIYSSKSVFLLNKKKSSKYISYSVETSTKMFQLFV